MENALFEEEKIAALRAAFLVSTCYGSSKSDSSFACTAGGFWGDLGSFGGIPLFDGSFGEQTWGIHCPETFANDHRALLMLIVAKERRILDQGCDSSCHKIGK